MSSNKELAKRFHALEDEALSGLKGINAVGKLVAHVEDPQQSTASKMAVVHSLRRVFVGLVRQGRFRPLAEISDAPAGAPGEDAAQIAPEHEKAVVKVARWLRTQLRAFLGATTLLVATGDINVQVPALRTIMHFVRLHAFTEKGQDQEGVSQDGSVDGAAAERLVFGVDTFNDLVRVLLSLEPWSERFAKHFRDEYVSRYGDVRFYLLRAVESLAAERGRAARMGAGGQPGADLDAGGDGGDGAAAEEAALTPRGMLAAAAAATVSRAGFQALSTVSCPAGDAQVGDFFAMPAAAPEPGPSFLRQRGSADQARKRRRKRQKARSAALADAAAGSDDEAAAAAAERGDAAPPEQRTVIGGADWDSDEEAAARRRRSAGEGTGTAAARRSAADADYDEESALFNHGGARKHVRDASVRVARKRAQERRARGARHAAGHRRAFNAAWLAFLRLPHSADTYKRALVALPDRILPHLTTPLQLATFLTAAYDQGGVLSMLALSGLFELMNRHNLEYPDFYPRLFRLLTPQLMHAKHRTRFFRLLSLFLSSTHLPMYLVAAFVKRMARLCLHAPPPAPLFLLPLIYNLIRRHPECMLLLRRGSNARQQTGLLDRVAMTAAEVAEAARRREDEELRALGVEPAEIDRRRREKEEEEERQRREEEEADRRRRGRKRQRRHGGGGEDGADSDASGEVADEDLLEPEAPPAAAAAAAPVAEGLGDTRPAVLDTAAGAAGSAQAAAAATAAAAAAAARPQGKETFVARAKRLAEERRQEEEERAGSGRGLKAYGVSAGLAAELGEGRDPFLEHEQDPRKCRALESTLWEIATLRNHYDPSVARLANVFVAPMTRQRYDLEPLAGFTYTSRMGEEMERRGRPTTEIYAPFTLFGYCDDSVPATEQEQGKGLSAGAGVEVARDRLRIAAPGAGKDERQDLASLTPAAGIFDFAL